MERGDSAGDEMITNDEVISQVLTDIPGLTREEVIKALEIAKSYDRHYSRFKFARRQERQVFLAKRELEKQKAAHPERCFCIEDGLEVEHDLDTIKVLRVEKRPYYAYPTMERIGDYDEPIYECPRCGKEWQVPAAVMA